MVFIGGSAKSEIDDHISKTAVSLFMCQILKFNEDESQKDSRTEQFPVHL